MLGALVERLDQYSLVLAMGPYVVRVDAHARGAIRRHARVAEEFSVRATGLHVRNDWDARPHRCRHGLNSARELANEWRRRTDQRLVHGRHRHETVCQYAAYCGLHRIGRFEGQHSTVHVCAGPLG